MHPQQLRHAYRQCLAETDRPGPAGPPHGTSVPAAGAPPPPAQVAGSIFDGLGRWLSARVAAAAEPQE